jgi:hypothetical protein
VPADDELSPDQRAGVRLYDELQAKAVVTLKAFYMEHELPWPGDDSPIARTLLVPALGVGISTAMQHVAQYPEDVISAGIATCQSCGGDVSSWTIGYEHGEQVAGTVPKTAWPCGHRQPTRALFT